MVYRLKEKKVAPWKITSDYTLRNIFERKVANIGIRERDIAQRFDQCIEGYRTATGAEEKQRWGADLIENVGQLAAMQQKLKEEGMLRHAEQDTSCIWFVYRQLAILDNEQIKDAEAVFNALNLKNPMSPFAGTGKPADQNPFARAK